MKAPFRLPALLRYAQRSYKEQDPCRSESLPGVEPAGRQGFQALLVLEGLVELGLVFGKRFFLPLNP